MKTQPNGTVLAAEQNHMMAQANLGLLYLSGDGVPRSEIEAAHWLELSAEQGFADAQYHMGLLMRDGVEIKQDLPRSVKWLKAAAEQGHGYAQENLGLMYRTGLGVPIDAKESEKWYAMVEKQRAIGGTFQLAPIEKVIVHNKAGDQVHMNWKGPLPSDGAEVMIEVKRGETGSIYEIFPAESLIEQASVGDSEAQYRLCRYYWYKDQQAAFKWAKAAADHGNLKVQFFLGMMYLEGRGADKDETKAVSHLTAAAEQGNAVATIQPRANVRARHRCGNHGCRASDSMDNVSGQNKVMNLRPNNCCCCKTVDSPMCLHATESSLPKTAIPMTSKSKKTAIISRTLIPVSTARTPDMTIYRPKPDLQMRSQHWLTLIFSGLLSACSAPPTKAPTPTALDSDVVTMPSIGKTVSRQSAAGVKPMTSSELTVCAQRIIKAKEGSLALQKENVKLAAEKTELYKQTQALDEQRGRIKTDSIKAVNDFNRRIQANHDDIKTHNAAVNDYNDKASALNLLNGKYNTECGNRSYRQSDYASLKPDLKAAIDSKSEITDIPLIEDSNAVNAPAGNSGQFHIPARSTR